MSTRRLVLTRSAALIGAASAILLSPRIVRAQAAKVRVGFMLPYTGTFSQLGVAIENGFRLAINEQGTEAAAATAVTTRTASIRLKLNDDKLSVDKPFIFALRDKVSGLVLVSGYVGSIPAEATQ